MKKLNLAIVGIGHLGSRHLKVCCEGLSSKINVVGICDLDKKRTLKFCEHYKVPYIKDYKELVGKIDAVNVCVPTTNHFEVAKFFLENKIHTFIEKPITSTLKEADQLIEIAQKNNLKLQVGH